MTHPPHLVPSEFGYHMPAEWETHEGTWLAWPKNPLTWFHHLPEVQNVWLQMIKELSSGEIVNVLVDRGSIKKEVALSLIALGVDPKTIGKSIKLHILPTRDAWLRDTGPIFIVNREEKKKAMLDWIFNAWGQKYVSDEDPLDEDTCVPRMINELYPAQLRFARIEPGIVLEGGSLDTNGKGTLLTTRQCLLNKNRNPALNQQQIEDYLKNYLGVQKIIWLNDGVAGDDTDGHVDDIARFVNENTIVCAFEDDPNDENYKALAENYETLCNATDQDGKKFNVIKMPMPGLVEAVIPLPGNKEPQRFPASYINFYIGNEVVLVPIFGHLNDGKALQILRDAFPTRRVVGLRCEHVVWGFGSLHCVSQQEPSV